MHNNIHDLKADEMEAVLALNQSAVPHVNSLDAAELRWFADHAAYFRVAGATHAFLIGLRPGLEYASPNYRWFCERYADFAYVDRIVVAADARRRGLATLLYADFQAALPPSVPVLTCEVNVEPPNPGSLRFHERQGFERVGAQTTESGAKRVALLAKPL